MHVFTFGYEKEDTVIQKLDKPVMVNRYYCEYGIVLPETGVKIYFANVNPTDIKELYDLNYVATRKVRDEDADVLVPDLTEPERESYLVLMTWSERYEIHSIRQNMLCAFSRINRNGHYMTALYRDAPELYPNLRKIYCKLAIPMHDTEDSDKNSVCGQLLWPSYTARYSPKLVYKTVPGVLFKEDHRADPVSYKRNSFVMLLENYEFNGIQTIHPSTTFKIGTNNIIFVPENVTISEIKEYLNNENIPNSVSIIWTRGNHLKHVKRVIDDGKAVTFHGRSRTRHIILGYDYETTMDIRLALDGEKLFT